MIVRSVVCTILGFFILPSLVLADQLPFSFINNGIKLVASRSGSADKSFIKLEVKAPQKTEVQITEAANPTRIILDFRHARLTRNQEFPIKDSPLVSNIRFGVHPNFFRVVIELKSKTVPLSTYTERGDWFTLTITEMDKKRGIGVGKVEEDKPWENKESELKFSANLWNKTTFDTKDDLKTEQEKVNSLELKPELVYTHDNNLDATVSGRFKMISEFGNDVEDRSDNISEVRLYNAYVSYSGESYSIKAGNQIVTWGKADEISPLDNVNPEDMRDGPIRRRNERKIPIPMLNAEVFARGDRLQFLFIPVYKRSRVDLYGTDWAAVGSEINTANIVEDTPSNGLDNAEYGVRYMSDAASVDYSISFLSTTNDLPTLKSFNLPAGLGSISNDLSVAELAALANANNIPIGVEYNRREIAGFDFETVVDSFGIRGDFAYTRAEDFINSDLQAVRSPTYRYTLGVDYTSSSDFYINVQYLQTIIDDYKNILLNEEVQNGFFSEISKEFLSNNYKIGLRSLQGTPQTQYYYNPYLKLQQWDNLSFEFGAELLGGEQTSPLGFYTNNDNYYLIVSAYY